MQNYLFSSFFFQKRTICFLFLLWKNKIILFFSMLATSEYSYRKKLILFSHNKKRKQILLHVFVFAFVGWSHKCGYVNLWIKSIWCIIWCLMLSQCHSSFTNYKISCKETILHIILVANTISLSIIMKILHNHKRACYVMTHKSVLCYSSW